MRRVLCCALLLGAFGAMGVGRADPTTLSGTIPVGNPAQTAGAGGLTENLSPCDPAGAAIDGIWFDIAGHEGDAAVLTLTGPNAAASDADAYFYTAECARIAYTAMAQQFIGLGAGPFVTNTETGTVPEGAAFAIVNGFFGASIGFELTLTPAEG